MGLGKSSGSSAGTQVVQTQQVLPDWLKEPLTGLFGVAEKAADITPASPYQGERLAPVTQEQLGALDLGSLLATGSLGLGQGAIDLGQFTTAGGFLSPESNPWIQRAAEAAIRPLEQQFRETVLPSIGSAAMEQGAYFGSMLPQVRAHAGRDYLASVGDITSRIFAENYARERALQERGPTLTGQGFALQREPISTLAGVGDVRRALGQELLNSLRQEYEEALGAPWVPIERLAGVLGLGTQGAGTSTTTTTAAQPSRMTGFLQGALGGGALGGGVASALGVTGLAAGWPYLAGGAALGGLTGFFS